MTNFGKLFGALASCALLALAVGVSEGRAASPRSPTRALAAAAVASPDRFGALAAQQALHCPVLAINENALR